MTATTTKKRTRRAPEATHPFREADGLALLPERAREALELVAPASPAAYQGDGCDPLEDVDVIDGVAIVSIRGMLLASSWWCENYASIVARTKAALAASTVRAVVLSIDSPGGVVAGLFDAMRALRTAKAASGKRMVAHTSGGAYSAAYGLASVCDEIAVTDTAGVGSIGVIDTLVSRVGEFEQAGLDVRVIASGEAKTDGHPGVKITPAAEKRKRARVMQLAAMFGSEVGAGRPALTAAAITDLDGGVRYGLVATAAGLADRIATLDEVLAGLTPPAAAPPPNPYALPTRPLGAATPKDPTAMLHEKLAALIAAKTGETDPERQMGALQAMFETAENAPTLTAELAAMKAARAAEKAAAEKAARTQAFEAALKGGQDAGKLTPAEAAKWRDGFEKGEVTLGVLEGNLACRTPIAALTQEHLNLRPPATPLPADAAQSARASALQARPYGALTWDERNDFATLAPEAHARACAAWVALGRPKG